MKKYRKQIPVLDKRKVTNERRIEPINHETGVTCEQLIEHLTFLSGIMKEARFLTSQQKNDAIYKTAQGVFCKMQEGKVDNKSFDLFKSYLYRSAHNQFLQERHRHEKQAEKITGGNEILDDFLKNEAFHPVYQQQEEIDEYGDDLRKRLHEAIEKLPAASKQIIAIFLNNPDKNLGQLGIRNNIASIRRKLKSLIFQKKKKNILIKRPRRNWSHIDYPYLASLIGKIKGHNMKYYLESKPAVADKVRYLEERNFTKKDIDIILKIGSQK